MTSAQTFQVGQVTGKINVTRRRFFQTAAGAALAAGILPGNATGAVESAEEKSSESAVTRLWASLSPEQKQQVCFAWDYVDPARGLLRTRISANWQVTKPLVRSDFYTPRQRQLIREIFTGLIQPDWIPRIDRQLKDDEGGFGYQSMAIFGAPGSGKFQFVLTGRHITIRCDGHSAEHLAFGGPIVYGHAASGFREKPGHPNNVFWHQAVAAGSVFQMLDGKQQAQALLKAAPPEEAIGFQGPQGKFPGIAVHDLSPDQKQHVEIVLEKLIEPYRQSDRDRVDACLKSQGGLDKCHLAFYEEGHLGNDRIWDIWRLEGPAFVWHFRGSPHVHTWVHVADEPSIKLNA
ncbi:MAG: DUF3500 domain-containing protein [Thermoguttaceae bacterium]